jgi:hypothetical protein
MSVDFYVVDFLRSEQPRISTTENNFQLVHRQNKNRLHNSGILSGSYMFRPRKVITRLIFGNIYKRKYKIPLPKNEMSFFREINFPSSLSRQIKYVKTDKIDWCQAVRHRS